MKKSNWMFGFVLVTIMSLSQTASADEGNAGKEAQAQLCTDYLGWCGDPFKYGFCDPQECVSQKVNLLSCLYLANKCMPDDQDCKPEYVALQFCEAKGKPFCGDGVINQPWEQCDDGNPSNKGICPACKPATCGDGNVQEGVEQCDDYNVLDGDGCSSTCMFERGSCGDGLINFSEHGVEGCDDHNTFSWDGCSATCQQETQVSWTDLILLECNTFIENCGVVWSEVSQELMCSLDDPCFKQEVALAGCMNQYGVCTLDAQSLCNAQASELQACHEGDTICMSEIEPEPTPQ